MLLTYIKPTQEGYYWHQPEIQDGSLDCGAFIPRLIFIRFLPILDSLLLHSSIQALCCIHYRDYSVRILYYPSTHAHIQFLRRISSHEL